MARAFSVAFALFITLAPAGCGVPNLTASGGILSSQDTLDLCQSAPAGRSCVTLHLHGDVGLLDAVEVDSTFELGQSQVTRRVISHGPATGATPPIAVGVVLSLDAGDYIHFVVTGMRLGKPAAIGTTYASSVKLGDHASTDVQLDGAASSRCFDNFLDGNERDVDCGGGECPACVVGQKCLTPDDCADSVCSAPWATTDYRCN
jgi:hypothetical protein